MKFANKDVFIPCILEKLLENVTMPKNLGLVLYFTVELYSGSVNLATLMHPSTENSRLID